MTQAFFEGDERSYGAKQLAAGWRKLGNVHRTGVGDVSALLRRHDLRLRSDVDALELERRFLGVTPWGHSRMDRCAPGE